MRTLASPSLPNLTLIFSSKSLISNIITLVVRTLTY
jgi:hypothetical protein